LARAMSVGVGLDDGDDAGRNRGTAAGAAIQSRFVGEIRGNRLEVCFKRLQIDARGGAADHADITTQGLAGYGLRAYSPGVKPPLARLPNRVCSRMKASFTVPVGPLRCLAMMISAMPSVSDG